MISPTRPRQASGAARSGTMGSSLCSPRRGCRGEDQPHGNCGARACLPLSAPASSDSTPVAGGRSSEWLGLRGWRGPSLPPPPADDYNVAESGGGVRADGRPPGLEASAGKERAMGVTLPSVWLNELTWEEVAAYLATDDIVLWPIGSTEQHGPGGPLGVDTYVAIMLAEDAARRANVLCVPPLWYGDSSHHLGFPGTLSLRTETLMLVVRDVAHSLAKHGFRKSLIINGHKGANLPGLLAATKNLREFELPEVFFAVIDPMKLARGI